MRITLAVAAVFAAAAGFVAGFVTTFTHRVAAPWGLVAGITVVVALVAGFRLVFEHRLFGAAAAIGVIAATWLLALPGAGGAVLVLDDALGYAWAIVPPVLMAIVAAVPARRRGPLPRRSRMDG